MTSQPNPSAGSTAAATAWNALVESRALEPLDAQLGRFVARRAAQSRDLQPLADLLGRSIALCSRERNRGHSCVFLGDWAGTELDAESGDPFGAASPHCAPFPELDAWRTQLAAASQIVGDGTRPTPLALIDDRLYLHRFLIAERRLAERLRARAAAEQPAVLDPERFAALFPPLPAAPDGDAVDWQALATFTALHGRLAVVLGGPGTGKTTTVARLLALLLETDPEIRVRLAAPTGKAATRLVESIQGQLDHLELSDAGREALAALPPAVTLHRLLGYHPGSEQFRHGARSPLPADLVVVDEASMIDLELMDALLAAVPDTARLVLLGDPDQLASVATGHVLGDVLTATDPDRGCSAERARAFAAHGDRAAPEIRAEPHPLQDCVVRLRRTWRFAGGIAELANAVRHGAAKDAVAALDDPDYEDTERRPAFDPRHPAATLAELDDWLFAVHAAKSPADALEAFERARVLCAVRRGPQGLETLNAAIEARLASLGLPSKTPGTAHYHGQPLLVTVNDLDGGLFNGDVGIVWQQGGEPPRVYFASDDPQAPPRAVSTGRLPPAETAWAMTVHKSQGSEYGRVLMILPSADSPVATRELIYTGVTRARKSVVLAADATALERAIARRTRRDSGLVERLTLTDLQT